MSRLGSFCKLGFVVLVPLAAGAQTIVSYGAAAATGSTAGAAAGNKLNKALDNVLGKTSEAMGKAGQSPKSKSESKPSEMIHMSVAPEAVARTAAPKTANVHPLPKVQQEDAAIIVPAANIEPPPVTATPEVLATVASGAKRDDLTKLGEPAYRISIPEDGHLVEVYKYRSDGKDIGTVRLTDGVVTSVQSSQN